VTAVREASEAPIVVVSARVPAECRIAALDRGANDYVTRPFGVGELLARIRAVLRSAALERRATPRPLVVGKLSIDVEGHTVSHAGREVHLSPLEFKLLSVLARNAGAVLTREELLEAAWGTDAKKNATSLRVYMCSLRNKLERNPARPKYLVNEPGVGYRIKVP
jgi:two-component system KDP operon response regulator KdpE